MLEGARRTHDAHAHGETTLLFIGKPEFQAILGEHVELYDALLRQHADQLRQLSGLVEDLNRLPLRARLARRLLHLVRSDGVPVGDGSSARIGLRHAQEELAQLVGASRQRVNDELQSMERENVIRMEPTGVVVLEQKALAWP